MEFEGGFKGSNHGGGGRRWYRREQPRGSSKVVSRGAATGELLNWSLSVKKRFFTDNSTNSRCLSVGKRFITDKLSREGDLSAEWRDFTDKISASGNYDDRGVARMNLNGAHEPQRSSGAVGFEGVVSTSSTTATGKAGG